MSRRDHQRETTRAQLFEATVSEFRRVGFAATEIAVITERVGVSRGAFYVHFAGKEAVLVELLAIEERRVADRVRPLVAAGEPMVRIFQTAADSVLATEKRLGRRLTQDLCATQFRPELEPGTVDEHPLASLLVDAMSAVRPGSDAIAAATVFLTGLFGLLATGHGSGPERRRCIDLLVQSVAKGIDAP
jgi:AcrR family transcriptional regulator